MLLTIVLVLIVTREMTPGRLIGVGLAMALVLTVSVLEERDGLISRFATNLTSDRVVTEQFSDRRPNRRSPPPPEESQSSTSSTETLRESQEIFRREARRRRRRRRREALRKHLLSDNASDPESPSSDSSRVLARTSAEGDARTQPMQFQTEWVLGWETPQKTDELVLDVVRDGHVVRTLETPPEATRGTSDPFPPGEYAVRVHSSGKWTLLLMKADSRG